MRWKAIITAGAVLQFLSSCSDGGGDEVASIPSPSLSSFDLARMSCAASAASYRLGQEVIIDCSVTGSSAIPVDLKLDLIRLDESLSNTTPSLASVTWPARRSTVSLHWTPAAFDAGQAFVLVAGGTAVQGLPFDERVKTTTRVIAEGDLTRFTIDRHDVDGMYVYDLAGGMSAEYALEKSLAGLAGGISHSWQVSRSGHGPKPVFATRNFLADSVRETVSLYDRELGADRVFDTAILSTGYPTVPYLSQALGAPVLPLHFLASADSVAEIRTVLNGAIDAGYSAYATLGHDPSVDHSVAWIKLLDLPSEYRDFLIRHQVRRVIITGSTGTSGGETKARKIGEDANVSYNSGDIYLMYPGTSLDDEESLATNIHDLRMQTHLSNFLRITDWESGVASLQVCTFARSIERGTAGATQALGLTPESLGDLYNLSTTLTAALMHKNRRLYSDSKQPASGIALNPYLMAYPAYEFRQGYLPLVYFQVVPANSTLSRVESVVVPALKKYFPERDVMASQVWLNSSKNFGGRFFGEPYEDQIARLGFNNVRLNNYDADEQWSPDDGQVSIVELLVDNESNLAEDQRLKDWAQKRQPLSLAEFEEVLTLYPDLRLASPTCSN